MICCTESVAQPWGQRSEISSHPSPILVGGGGEWRFRFELLCAAIFHCQNSMEKTIYMLSRAHVVSTRVNFKPHGAHPGLKRDQSRHERGPSKVKWAKNGWFSFLGGGSLDQEALPWIISPSSPTSGCATPQNKWPYSTW